MDATLASTNATPSATSSSQATTSAVMQAFVRAQYCPPEELSMREIPRPVPRDNEVLVRVRAASVNPADWFILTGKPFGVRFFAGMFKPTDVVPGRDAAGVVEAVGRNVTKFRPGDDVYGELCRAYAEYTCAPEDRVARMPSSLSYEEAAALPIAGITALQAMRDKVRVQPGHKVLINGASGGVGTFAVQIARAMGAEVTAVCSTRNVELVRSIGAAHVVDYSHEDFSKTAERYDAIFDLVGSASIGACRRVLKPSGVYVSSVGTLAWSIKAMFASLVYRSPRVKLLAADAKAGDLDVLTRMVEAGLVKPVIDRRFTLRETPAALRHQGNGHARGKSVIVV